MRLKTIFLGMLMMTSLMVKAQSRSEVLSDVVKNIKITVSNGALSCIVKDSRTSYVMVKTAFTTLNTKEVTGTKFEHTSLRNRSFMNNQPSCYKVSEVIARSDRNGKSHAQQRTELVLHEWKNQRTGKTNRYLYETVTLTFPNSLELLSTKSKDLTPN